jgi:hypothetical protein
MSMEGELYERVKRLEKQVEALMERHPEVRVVLERKIMVAMKSAVSLPLNGPQDNPVTPGVIERG